MIKYLFAAFTAIMLSLNSYGQATQRIVPQQITWLQEDAKFLFPHRYLNAGNSDADVQGNASAYLIDNIADLQNLNTGLLFVSNIKSPNATYLAFEQTFKSDAIYGTFVRIAIGKDNKIISVISKTADVSNWPSNISIQEPGLVRLKAASGDFDVFDWKKFWFYEENAGVPAYVVNCSKNNGTRSDEMVVNSIDYSVIYSHSILKNYKYPDSLVTMYVFYPDPLTSAQVSYGEPYTNHHDSDIVALDNEMIPKTMRTSVLNDSFFLENAFVRETDLAAPENLPSWSKSPVFHYKRDSSSFRDIMIFYHINRWREHLKDLGFDSLGNKQIIVDPSGLYDDNSTFDHQGYPKIWFGVGGIPDAEDADVSTHEYTHFLSWCACPGCSEKGFERESLDEGTADYFAASNSKSISTYNWQKVYNWDGNFGSWHGRSCTVTDIYPAGLNSGDIHLAGQMWSSALMEIQDVIGREKTDRIMLETLYTLAPNINMSQAAVLFIRSDSLLYNGYDVYTIAHFFIKRGFLPVSYLGVTPVDQQIAYRIITNQFSTACRVQFDFAEPQTGSMTLYDITGRKIATHTISKSEQVTFAVPGIASGIYILGVSTNGLRKSFKLMK